jgi:hypothetical protein
MRLDWEALKMSSQILDGCVKRREARSAAVVASLIRFVRTGEDSFSAVPSQLSNDPTGKEISTHFLPEEDCFAYMVFLPGDPIPQKQWEGEHTPQQQSQILLGIPGKIIDVGEYVFHLHGIFVSNSIQRTFCAAFDGQKFAPLRVVNGVYGGTASCLGGVGVSA